MSLNSIVWGINGTIFLILGFFIYNLQDTIEEYEKEVTILQAEKTVLSMELHNQNKAIEKLRLDIEAYNKVIDIKKKELSIEREEQERLVEESLTKDNSITNQLGVVDEILKRFSTSK